MDKFLGQVVHEAAKIGRAVFLTPFQGHTIEPEVVVEAEPEVVVEAEPEVIVVDDLDAALEAVAKVTIDAVLEALVTHLPPQQPKSLKEIATEDTWADTPLSAEDLQRAKLLIAQKIDTQWEDR